ncbi:MAG: nucleotidyltransferase family protein [Terriglobia bacterium]
MNRRLALQIVDCLGAPGPDALGVWSRRDWTRTLPWLHASGLALPFLRILGAHGGESLPPSDVLERLERNQADNRERVACMAEEFAVLNRCFERSGIPFAALKGITLIPDYSPDATLRAQADFDYLIAPESLPRAEAALRAAGYLRRSCDENAHVYFHSARPLRIPVSEDELYSAALPRRVELHTALWEGGPESIHPTTLATALDRVRLREWRGLRFPALAPEDALAFQILHALRHVFGFWCRLSLLLEVAHFLNGRKHDEEFWRRFIAHIACTTGLPEATGVVITLAVRVFGAEVPAPLAAWLRATTPPTMKLWVERYGRDSALGNFMEDKFSLFLLREFIPDDAAWRTVCRRRILPLHRPNRAAEPRGPRVSSRVGASVKQSLHIARRVKFHVTSALRLGLEFPRWKWSRRAAGAPEESSAARTAEPIPAAASVPVGER